MNFTKLLIHSSLPVREISENQSSQLKKEELAFFSERGSMPEAENR